MIRAKITINSKVIDRASKRMKSIAFKAKKHEIRLGIHDGEGSKTDYNGKETGTTLVQVAAAHEFGIGVPMRSFLRPWFDSNRQRITRELLMAERAEFSGDSEAIQNVALRWNSEIRQFVITRQAKLSPLSKGTIDQRERAGIFQETPLFATGQLIESIRAMVDGKYA